MSGTGAAAAHRGAIPGTDPAAPPPAAASAAEPAEPPAAEERAEAVAARFRELYGAAPEGVWAAPGRVNLIGEHTDYNEGFVLPLALPHTVVAAVSRRTDGRLRLHSADTADTDGTDDTADTAGTAGTDGDGVRETTVAELAPPGGGLGWAAYPAGVVWALREAGHPVAGGADIHLASTVPTGAGLSSSAALEVVTALALDELHGLDLGRKRLALLAQRAENDFVGVPCGVMDQMASARATEGHALHLDTRDLGVRQIPFDAAAHGLRLLIVDTRVRHALGDGAYADRRAACERGARELGVRTLREVAYEGLAEALDRLADATVRSCVRHVVSDNERVRRVAALLTAGDIRAVGPVLTEGHASLRDDLRVSCPELDLAVTAATGAGALGARMTGGGFGGSAVVLVAEADADRVAAAVTEAFASAGHTAPRIFPAVPSPGARRLV
ncbi:galactokinase [Streptomyces sp. LP05-1]|uniref:Galactokinase n=1 Tax=Streptomyces pyxinae TaxID=2970734 RepID=A0ABT2CMA2_9ACTN|nr:galactokinase [Streptomyces sp. LP05-1]MCS0637831.1 galactokinase [Streptomyces sp. LP05-1]